MMEKYTNQVQQGLSEASPLACNYYVLVHVLKHSILQHAYTMLYTHGKVIYNVGAVHS